MICLLIHFFQSDSLFQFSMGEGMSYPTRLVPQDPEQRFDYVSNNDLN